MPNSAPRDYLSVTYHSLRTPQTEYPVSLARYLADKFVIKPGGKLLDLGCGRGDMLKAFNAMGMQCDAVDKIRSTVQNIDFCEIRIVDIEKESLPFEDNYFDMVFSKSVIEHMWDPFPMMNEVRRVLQTGGLCIVMTPDWVSQMDFFYEDPTHCRPYTLNTINDLLVMTGFERSGATLFYQHPYLWNSNCFRIIATTLRLFLKARHARWLTNKTKIKFFRWSIESMVLGWGIK